MEILNRYGDGLVFTLWNYEERQAEGYEILPIEIAEKRNKTLEEAGEPFRWIH